MKSELRWLGVYVALSRVRSFDSLKSIGLTKKIREDIERGPPDGILDRFEQYFGKKIEETYLRAEAAYKELGWDRK